MIRIYIVLFFTFLGQLLFAQNEKDGAFQFGLHLAPEISLSSLELGSVSSSNFDSSLGYTAGVKVRYQLSNNFSLESGLLFRNRSHVFRVNNFIDFSQIDPLSSFIESTNILDEVRFNILSVPILATYEISDNWHLVFGFSPDIYLNQSRSRLIINPPANEEEILRSQDRAIETFPFSFNVGFGRNFEIGKLDLELIPTFNYHYNDIEFLIENRSKNQMTIGLQTKIWIQP